MRKSGHLLTILSLTFLFLIPLSATNMPAEISVNKIHLQSSSNLNFTWTSLTQQIPQSIENNSLAIGDHVVVNATFYPFLNIINCELKIWNPQNAINATTYCSGPSIAFDTYYLSGSNATYNILVNGTTSTEESVLSYLENVTICNFFSPDVTVNYPIDLDGDVWNLTWSSIDQNAGDTPYYSIWLSRDGNPWVLLAPNITEFYYMWNATEWLEGGYDIRVRAYSVDLSSSECKLDDPPWSYWPGDYADGFYYAWPDHNLPPPLTYPSFSIESDILTYEYGSTDNILEVHIDWSGVDFPPTQLSYSVYDNSTLWLQGLFSPGVESFEINIDGLLIGTHELTIEILEFGSNSLQNVQVIVTENNNTATQSQDILFQSILIGISIGSAVSIIALFVFYKKRNF